MTSPRKLFLQEELQEFYKIYLYRAGDCHPHRFESFLLILPSWLWLLKSRLGSLQDHTLSNPGRCRCSCYSTNMMAKNQASAYDSWCQDKIRVEMLIGLEWRSVYANMRYTLFCVWLAYSLFLAFSLTCEQSIIGKACYLSSWWMRYGMIKETLLLFVKYLGNFLTKTQNQ